MDCIHFSCWGEEAGWVGGSDCRCGAGPAMGGELGLSASRSKGALDWNRCGSGLEGEGRRAGPRTIPAEEEVRSKAGRVWEGPCGVRLVQTPAPALTPSDSHSCCLLCSVLASPDIDVISASNQSQPVFTPHEPSLLWL